MVGAQGMRAARGLERLGEPLFLPEMVQARREQDDRADDPDEQEEDRQDEADQRHLVRLEERERVAETSLCACGDVLDPGKIDDWLARRHF